MIALLLATPPPPGRSPPIRAARGALVADPAARATVQRMIGVLNDCGKASRVSVHQR